MSRCPDASVVSRKVPALLRSTVARFVWSWVPAVVLALVVSAAPALADALIDVAGNVVALSPRLVVGVTLTNRGASAATGVEVEGELLGERSRTRLEGALEPGASADVALAFAAVPARPGLHALVLQIEYPVAGTPDGAGNPPLASQVAWLALAFGANPEPAVGLEATPLALDVRGGLLVRLKSRDGEEHRVRLRALTARGLRADTGPLEVVVPAAGQATVEVPIVRAGSPRASRQGLLLVAETKDGPLARTSVVAATVDVRADPALMPRLRIPLLVAGAAFVAVALAHESRTRSRARARPAPEA